jgi:hypothetical protein
LTPLKKSIVRHTYISFYPHFQSVSSVFSKILRNFLLFTPPRMAAFQLTSGGIAHNSFYICIDSYILSTPGYIRRMLPPRGGGYCHEPSDPVYPALPGSNASIFSHSVSLMSCPCSTFPLSFLSLSYFISLLYDGTPSHIRYGF